MIKTLLKNLVFVAKLVHILGVECVLYCLGIHSHVQCIDGVATRLASINILYVKVFQALALNHNLIDDTINSQLLKFTDQAPWDYSDVNLKELTDVAEHNDLHIGHGYEVPINAGMISLVFKMSKKNRPHEKVIIKMKRKNIEQRLNDAIDNLLFCLFFLSFVPMVHKYQLADVVIKNIDIVRHQTNFLEEVDNLNRFRENCKQLKYVKIPAVKREVTEANPNVILMEYIEGMKIQNVWPQDYDGFAKQVVKFGLVTTLVHGFAHGDLHSGNLLFIKDISDPKHPYKIGVIDFGIMLELSPHCKVTMFDLFTNMFEMSPRETAEYLLNSNVVEPPGILKQLPPQDLEAIVQFVESAVQDTLHSSRKCANQTQIYRLLSQINEHLSKKELMNIGVRPSDDFVKLQLVLAMAHGVTLHLCHHDFISLMETCLNELFHTQQFMN